MTDATSHHDRDAPHAPRIEAAPFEDGYCLYERGEADAWIEAEATLDLAEYA